MKKRTITLGGQKYRVNPLMKRHCKALGQQFTHEFPARYNVAQPVTFTLEPTQLQCRLVIASLGALYV